MATIEQLEQKIRQLEELIHQEEEKNALLMEKAEKAIETAQNCYKVDHYGFIYAYDAETKNYRKTKMRVMTPEISDNAIESRNLADNAIEGRHLHDEVIEGRHIKSETIPGRCFMPDIIDSEKIMNNSIPGDRLENDALIPGKLANDAVQERNIKDRNVTARKIALASILFDHIDTRDLPQFISAIAGPVDEKYTNITNELYDMIASLQVGGIALSSQFGDRTDIGIHQKSLTKAFGRVWDELASITHETYMDFTLTVQPAATFTDSPVTINITADCTDAISNFDSIKIYVDNVLIAESSDVTVFTASHTISQTSTVKAVGMILGKTITKETTAVKELPFFMGSGAAYTDVTNIDCLQPLEGTIEGAYDVTVGHTGDYLFIIIPLSHKDEFRRADMNGYEIPMTSTVMEDYVVYQSLNTYEAGTYNIDIDINS